MRAEELGIVRVERAEGRVKKGGMAMKRGKGNIEKMVDEKEQIDRWAQDWRRGQLMCVETKPWRFILR